MNIPRPSDAPMPTRKTYHKLSKDPPIQHEGRKQAIEDTCELGAMPSSRPSAAGDTSGNTAADNVDSNNPIEFWRTEGCWPSQLFEPDMEPLLAQRRFLSTLGRRKRADSASSSTPSDQKPREEKSAPYQDQRYETLLATKGSFMGRSILDVTSESKTICKNLLEGTQTYPENSLFRDDLFDATCRKVHSGNEARVLQDITRLIVPSAESLATCGAKNLEILTESVNEGWNNSVPLTGIRPQPDYSVGFRREAFTKDQLETLSPFIGDFLTCDLSFFMATYYMYFPFLACEVKCSAGRCGPRERPQYDDGRKNEVH